MTDNDGFEQLVEAAMDALPDWVVDEMDNVRVVIEDRPPNDQPTLLGLYHGVPLTARGGNYTNVLPDSITLYRSTIEAESFRSGEPVADVVYHTLVHELAHHFGIDDERLLEIDAY